MDSLSRVHELHRQTLWLSLYEAEKVYGGSYLPVAESAHSERYETELIIWIIRCQSQLVNSARNTEFEIVPVYAWDLSLAYFISEDCCVHV